MIVMEREYLVVESLSKTYGSLKAVDGVSFSVRAGEVFGLLGPNGAGKTTTISILCGLLKADGGKVVCGGLSLSQNYEKMKGKIGLCPQEIILWNQMTCFEQLQFMGISYGLSSQKASAKADTLLEALGLKDKRSKLAGTLSGGMQRRLNMALALVHDPELIILDEPQAGLDPQSRIMVREYIRYLAKDAHKTILLTTHDMEEADRLSDRVAIIDYGKILMLDTPDRIKDKTGAGDVLQMRLESVDQNKVNKFMNQIAPLTFDRKITDGLLLLSSRDVANLVPQVKKVLNELNLPFQDMTIRKRTLEDAFIAMTGRGLRE